MINYTTVVNKDWLRICQDKDCLPNIRVSYISKNGCATSQQSVNLNLLESSKYDDMMINFDTYHVGTGIDCTFYCDYHNEWLIVDAWVSPNEDVSSEEITPTKKHNNYTRIYNLKELSGHTQEY